MQVEIALTKYREEYAEYYAANKVADSPAMRDANPTIVLIPGIGMFCFGKTKTESRITGEFYVNAIHVMEGATALGDGGGSVEIPTSRSRSTRQGVSAFTPTTSRCPQAEAFKIEYWKLEEAKIRRQPPEKELSRRIVLVVGGGSGIGREVALLASQRGAHVVVADRDFTGANFGRCGNESIVWRGDRHIRRRSTSPSAMQSRKPSTETVAKFGGVDILINTAALFPSSPDGIIKDVQWAVTLEVNVTANYLLVDEASPKSSRIKGWIPA